jgi:xanthine dehydrogenase accessory factor
MIDAFYALHNSHSTTKTYFYQDNYTCFIELLRPAVSLIIVGAGNDAIPLTQMSKVLGWRVTLVDGRANYNTTERFPQVDEVIVAKPTEVTGQLNLDSRTVFMLMTHNYNYDMALLKHLLPIQLPFVLIFYLRFFNLIACYQQVFHEHKIIRHRRPAVNSYQTND